MLVSHLRPAPTSIDLRLEGLQTNAFERKKQLQKVQQLFEESQKLLFEVTSAKRSHQESFLNEVKQLENKLSEVTNSAELQTNSLREKKALLEKKIATLSIQIDRETINRQQFLAHLRDSLEIKFSFYFQKKHLEMAPLEQKIQQIKTFETNFNKKIKELEAIVQSWDQKTNQLHDHFFTKEDPYEPLKEDLRKLFLKIIFCKGSISSPFKKTEIPNQA